MRFNSSGKFNVTYSKKIKNPDKIINKIKNIQNIMIGKNWQFKIQDWKDTLKEAEKNDLIYCDPPYIGLDTQYYNDFSFEDADKLAKTLINSSSNFALSMWLENKNGRNEFIDKWFSSFPQKTTEHFYYIGGGFKKDK